MSTNPETPFDNIENSHQYVALLAEAIAEAQADVDAQIALAESERAERRLEAATTGRFQANQAEPAYRVEPRVLNDLRSLRRLLLEERTLPYAASEKTSGAGV